MATIDLDAFREQKAQGLITGVPHPTEELLIWNYTPKCQFERAWNEVTLQARGLITSTDGTIIARPFQKFFNYEEHTHPLPNEPFQVFEKLDGSLGILYFAGGKPFIATRGSFTSRQAVKATKILYDRYSRFFSLLNPAYTYLFEIIYPQNRIVVDYGEMEDLVLLAIIETETGREINIHSDPLFPAVQCYDGITNFATIKHIMGNPDEQANREGFVVRFASGLRLKMKFEDYKRLHAIMIKTTSRTVWEYLKESKSLSEVLNHVPPEFDTWVKKTSRELGEQYDALHQRVESAYEEVMTTTTVDLPFDIQQPLSTSQFKRIEKVMKKHLKERFADYPDIEAFLFIKWDNAKYYYPDGRRETNAKAALRLHLWDALYPERTLPFAEGEA